MDRYKLALRRPSLQRRYLVLRQVHTLASASSQADSGLGKARFKGAALTC